MSILGAGKIGEALLAGLLRSGVAPSDLSFAEQDPERASWLQQRYEVSAVSAAEAAGSSDVVLLAVKPQDIGPLAQQIAAQLAPQTLVVSVAAGISTAFLEQRLPPAARVVRVMPNTPMLVGEGMSVVAAGACAEEADLVRAEELLGSVGRVVRLPEAALDAVTALSGSGPAYVFLLAEALIDAGVSLGLSPSVAAELAIQTLVGSSVMLRDSGEQPAKLREAVTSPGGTTAAALRVLEDGGLRPLVSDALAAARDRSQELAAGL